MKIWPEESNDKISATDVLAFKVSDWVAQFPPRKYEISFPVKDWKSFTPSGFLEIKKLKLSELNSDTLAFLTSSATGPAAEGYSNIPRGVIGVVAVSIEAADEFDAVDQALHRFRMHRSIRNVLQKRITLQVYNDTESWAVISCDGKLSKIDWNSRGGGGLQRTSINVESPRLRAEHLSHLFPDFAATMTAYSDAMNASASNDYDSALRALCAGFENLIDPLIEELPRWGINREIGQVDNAKILAKIIAMEYPQELLEKFLGEVNNKNREEGKVKYGIREILKNLSKHKMILNLLVESLGDAAFDLYPYLRAFEYARSSPARFFSALYLRFYVDLLHAIAARNSIVHENANIADGYTLTLLGCCFRAVMSIRIASAERMASSNEGVGALDRGRADELGRKSQERFVKYLLLLLYQFNWLNGLLDRRRFESLIDGWPSSFPLGPLNWHDVDFKEKLDASFGEGQGSIYAAINELGSEFFLKGSDNDALLS